MARKISVVMDAKPRVPSPKVIEESRSFDAPPLSEHEEIDYDAIEERESEIDELVADFICGLMGADEPDEREMAYYALQDELESIKDEIEELLANHGITIYRPTIIEDVNGNEIVANSVYEQLC